MKIRNTFRFSAGFNNQFDTTELIDLFEKLEEKGVHRVSLDIEDNGYTGDSLAISWFGDFE